MKKIYLKLLLFLSPFFLNALLIILVDPYNFYNIFHIIPDENKKKCIGRTMETTPRGNICWKLIEYKRKPENSILIGDSRIAHIKDSISIDVLGKMVYNFSIPGANFYTIRDIFWEAAKNKNLKEVYLQISFLNFSKSVNYDLMKSLYKFTDEPLKYMYDKDIIRDTWVNIYYTFTKNENFIDLDYRERDVDNWERTEKLSLRRLEKFEYSTEFEEELAKIAAYCNENSIKLTFILLPTHKDFIEKIRANGFEDNYSAFKAFFTTLAPVIDFKYMEETSMDNLIYEDYFHYQIESLDSLTRLIWMEAKKEQLY